MSLGAASRKLKMSDLTSLETHFGFGENWRSFVTVIDEEKIAQAVADLERLVTADELMGRRFLDVGSGSGLSALAAAGLGAHVDCTDIDPSSIEATRTLLGRHLDRDAWRAEVVSVFDLGDRQADIVHSWGVLHHTGDMWRAIDLAAACVKPGGLFVLAIYAKTPLCGFWRVEKRMYIRSPKWMQAVFRGVFKVWEGLLAMLQRVRGKGRPAYGDRGMDRAHDIHDWLGGYPYESATPEEIHDFLEGRGFKLVREILQPGRRLGLLGSGCDQYVFKRIALA